MSGVDFTTYDSLTGLPLASQEFVNAIIGPYIIGWMVQLMFWGVVASQYFVYLSTPNYATETTRIKAILYSVLVLATVHSGLSFWSLYHYATSQYRDTNTLYSQTMVDCFGTVFVGLEGAIVQVFLAHRASSLFSNRILKTIYFGFVGVGAALSLVGAILYLVLSLQLRQEGHSTGALTFNIVTSMWLWGSAFVDILITASLCVLLKSRIVGFNASTDGVLQQLIKLAVETALYTSVCAFLGAVLSNAFNEESLMSNSSGAFWEPLSSFYALALLVNLNSRSRMRQNVQEGYATNKNGGLSINVTSSQVIVSDPPRIFNVSTHVGGMPQEYEYEMEGKRKVGLGPDV